MAFFTVPLIAGLGEMGLLAYDSIEVSNAAAAGASYGMQSSTFASNTSGIATAAQMEAADFGSALSVTSSTYYACAAAINGTHYTGSNAQSDATSACTGTDNHALPFVQVVTTLRVTPMIRCPGLPSSYNLTGTSVMEVEQ